MSEQVSMLVSEPTSLSELGTEGFDQAEEIIESGRQTFVEVGLALRQVRDLGGAERRRRGYATFEDYMLRRWGWHRRHGYELMDAAEVAASLTEIVRSTAHFSAAHAVTLAPLSPSARLEVAKAVDFSTTPVRELRQIVKQAKEALNVKAEERRQEERATLPLVLPAILPADVTIEVADAAALPLSDDSVDLIVTSPPYGLDKAYSDAAEPDRSDDNDWRHNIALWLREMFRVARVGGRLAINVPLDTTRGGYRPTYAQTVFLADLAGWRYRSSIVWAEQNVSKSVARGSVDSPAAPHVIAPVEMIALFSKGDWKRETPAGVTPDLAHDEWLAWTNGLWTFSGESRAWEGHPAAFPPELPRRLIRLLSFPGDTVLDPFLGSGTTALVAWELGRRFNGFDLNPEYVESARRRLVAREGAR